MQPESLTYCADCAHLYQVNPRDAPYRWLCQKFKRMDGFGFVTKDKWDDMPPYAYCKDINHGACPLWQKAAPGQTNLPMETEERG